jgi:hypothetical protein
MTNTSTVKAAALLFGVAIAGALTACSSAAHNNSAPAAQAPAAPAPVAAPAVADAGKPVVVSKVVSDASLKEDYKTLAELAKSPNAKLIVTGTVVEAAPVYEGQLAYTKLTVKVAKSSDKKVPAGSKVVIYRDGGLIPLAQVLPDLKDDPAAPLPKSAPADAVVDFEFMGAEQSAAGDQIMAFLHPDPNVGREGAYQAVSSVHGLLKLDRAAGKYHRLGEALPGYEVETSAATAEKLAVAK